MSHKSNGELLQGSHIQACGCDVALSALEPVKAVEWQEAALRLVEEAKRPCDDAHAAWAWRTLVTQAFDDLKLTEPKATETGLAEVRAVALRAAEKAFVEAWDAAHGEAHDKDGRIMRAKIAAASVVDSLKLKED